MILLACHLGLRVSAGIYVVKEEIFSDQIITYLVLGFCGGLLKSIYFLLIGAAGSLEVSSVSLSAARLGGNILLGTVCAPLVYLLVFHLFRNRKPKRGWAQ